jgi:hypothetical protein
MIAPKVLPHRKPFPHRHPKPYTPEKPKGAKAMTIAVGFLCGNGDHLILAADRIIKRMDELGKTLDKIESNRR